jgi:hypothetical protein
MQVPEPVANPVPVGGQPPQERPARLRRHRPPRNHNQELEDRQLQERRDEELARRLQNATLDDDDDYQGDIGNMHGVGNAANHFMNQDYVRAAHNILTGAYDQATAAADYVMGVRGPRGGPDQARMSGRYPMPEPPPLLRRHSAMARDHNQAFRPAERVIPRRTRTDYEGEAAVHVPGRRESNGDARPSVLAGLSGRSGNRVSAWRSHIELGATPEEGMLSI